MPTLVEDLSHRHGPKCGHLAIAHLDYLGGLHVGFIGDNGDLACYSLPTDIPDVPRGSLTNICLQSDEDKLGFHRRGPACLSKKNACWMEAAGFYPLVPVSLKKKCTLHVSATVEPARKAREESCTAVQPTAYLQHEDHLDMLVRDFASGNIRSHCHTKESGACQVNAVLIHALGMDGCSASSPWHNSRAAWLDLFIVPEQVSTSIIKVSKGLCCKKEVPKVESVLAKVSASQKNLFRTEVDAKAKTVTIWHGQDSERPLQWMLDACKALRANGFVCSIVSLGEELVVRSEVVVERIQPLANEGEEEEMKEMDLDLTSISATLLNSNIALSVESLAANVLSIQHLERLKFQACTTTLNTLKEAGFAATIKRVGEHEIIANKVELGSEASLLDKVNEALHSATLDLASKDELNGLVAYQVHSEDALIKLNLFIQNTPKMDGILKRILDALTKLDDVLILKLNGAVWKENTVEAVLGSKEEETDTSNNNNNKVEVQQQEASAAAVVPVDSTLSSAATLSSSHPPTELPAAASIVGVKPQPESKPEMVRSVLSIEGVCCQAEVPSVLSLCRSLPGVADATVSVITKQVTIVHESTQPQIALECAKLLSSNDFPSVVLSTGGGKVAPMEKGVKSGPKGTIKSIKWYVLLATILWLVSWLSYISHPDGFQYLKYLSVGAVALGLPKIAIKGLKALRRGILDINILMSIAVIGALALQDFHEAASVTVIFSWSDWLEDRASRKARQAILALMELKPELARTEAGDEISVEDVVVDQILVVRTGDKIPVDSILLSDYCEVDESNLTGEARPVVKRKDEPLSAGTILVSAVTVQIKCTALAKDSAVARMIRLVEEASNSRSPTEQMIETIAKYYTPLVILVALCMATFPWIAGTDVGNTWLRTALTLLVVACPCALIISTPIAYVCALAQSASFGVVVKGGRYLEVLARVDRLACDKTGTLTQGMFEVDAVFESKLAGSEAAPGHRAWTYSVLRNVERHATHPVARAIQRHCDRVVASMSKTDMSSVGPSDIDQLEILPGQGVKGIIPSTQQTFYLVKGSIGRELIKDGFVEEGAAWSEAQQKLGRTVSWFIIDNVLEMAIAASDQVRESAGECLDSLLKLHVESVCLTGDNLGAGQVLHDRLPQLSHVLAGLTPAQKVENVQELKENGKHVVSMIGDGVNDAPALSASDVGIAMGVGGAPLALETADCALMDNDLLKIPRLLKLAKRTRMKLIENISFSLISKAAMLGLTIAGFISLAVAIAVDVGSMLIVTLNGVSLLEGKRVKWNFRKCFGHDHGLSHHGQHRGHSHGKDHHHGDHGHDHGHSHDHKHDGHSHAQMSDTSTASKSDTQQQAMDSCDVTCKRPERFV